MTASSPALLPTVQDLDSSSFFKRNDLGVSQIHQLNWPKSEIKGKLADTCNSSVDCRSIIKTVAKIPAVAPPVEQGDKTWLMQYCRTGIGGRKRRVGEAEPFQKLKHTGTKEETNRNTKKGKKKRRKWLPPLGPRMPGTTFHSYDWVHTNPEAFATLANGVPKRADGSTSRKG